VRLDELVAHAARRHGGQAAVADGRGTCSFTELQARVARAAAALHALGLRPGGRLATLSRNRVELLELVLAASRLGAAYVPLSFRLKPPEVGQLLADAGPALLLGEPDLLEAAAAALPPALPVVPLGDAPGGWEARLAAAGASPPPAPAADDDAALQMYTSGTTGRPKGALLSHGNLESFLAVWRKETRLTGPPERVHVGTPLFHVGGLVMSLTALSAGACVSLHAEFDPQRALATLADDAITHALFVPAMLRWMLLDPDARVRRYPALRLIVYGAAPIPPAQLAEALRVFGCGFLQGYGLTETTGALTVLRPEDHVVPRDGEPAARLASAGRVLSCCVIRVVDEQGRPVPAGQVGEVEARGSNVTRGYWAQPQADAESFHDGWFRTGDLGVLDADGYLTLVDRSKDLILVGGENVYPRRAEEALLTHAAVADVAVIGIPHAVWGEEVLALVALKPGAAAGDRELIAHCRATLSDTAGPTRVEFRDALPRNAAGKLDKRSLRAPYWAGRERRL